MCTGCTNNYNVSNVGPASVAVFDSVADLDSYNATVAGFGPTPSLNQLSTAAINAGGKVVSPNRSEYVDVNNLVANRIYVVSLEQNKNADVSVTASATATRTAALGGGTTTLVAAEAKSVKFVASNVVGKVETGLVESYNTSARTITLAGKDPIKYAGEAGKTYVFEGLGGSTIANAAAFLSVVNRDGATITVKETDDTKTFTIISLGGGVPVNTVAATAVQTQINELAADGSDDVEAVLAAAEAYDALPTTDKATVNKADLDTALNAEITALDTFIDGLTATDYTIDSWTAVTDAQGLPEATYAEDVAHLTALNDAVTELASAVTVTISGLTFTFAPVVADADVVINTALAATTTTDVNESITGITVNPTTNAITVTGTVDAADVITATVTVNGVDVEVEFTSADNGTTWVANPASPITAR